MYKLEYTDDKLKITIEGSMEEILKTFLQLNLSTVMELVKYKSKARFECEDYILSLEKTDA
jgi:hypothetical protein